MSQLNPPIPQNDLDRRNATRVDFDARVSVCEYDPVRKSATGDFRPVRSSDLSQSGISFVTTEWPTNDRLIVDFGDSNPTRAIVQVVNVRVDLSQELSRFEVSCQFQDWLPGAAKGK